MYHNIFSLVVASLNKTRKKRDQFVNLHESENAVSSSFIFQQAAEPGPSSAVSSHLELEEDIYQEARQSKDHLILEKAFWMLGKKNAEGINRISLQEERLHKLVQCIGKCDVCYGEISLQSRYEHFEVVLKVKCKECDNVVYKDEPETM